MTLTDELDLHDRVNASKTPRAEVSKVGGAIELQLPYPVFRRALEKSDGRTHTFFVKENELMAVQRVTIVSYNGQRQSATGVACPAKGDIPDKWFVQIGPVRNIIE